MEFWMTFHSVGNVIIPTDELISFRGVGLNHQPVYIWPCLLVSQFGSCLLDNRLGIWGMGSDSISHQDGSAGCLMCWTQESYVVTTCYNPSDTPLGMESRESHWLIVFWSHDQNTELLVASGFDHMVWFFIVMACERNTYIDEPTCILWDFRSSRGEQNGIHQEMANVT